MALAVFRPVLLTLSLLICSESSLASSELVEEGGSSILPCNNTREGQSECNGTTWTFNKKSDETLELITHGKSGSSGSEMSKRLRVTQKCDLEILNVLPEDAGVFHCQQYDQSGRHLPPDARVYLSVVSLTKEEDEEKVELSCKVSSDLSDVQIKWLFKTQDVQNSDLQSITKEQVLTVPKSHSLYKNVDQLKCEVSVGVNKVKFSLRSNKPGWLWAGWLGAVLKAAVAGLVTVVVVVTWRKLRVKRGGTGSDPTAEPEGGVFYATVSYNTDNQSTEVRQRDAVIYSSVKKTTVEDPSQLYATVKK